MNEEIDIIDNEQEYIKEFQKYAELNRKKIERIKKSLGTIEIHYPTSLTSQQAYRYVNNLFPDCNIIIDVTIYEVTPSYLASLGYNGVGGFCDIQSKTVVVSSYSSIVNMNSNNCWLKGKITKDEVMVHELLHYCYLKMDLNRGSVPLAEEFAYGWSLAYLRSKGYSDKYIIENNYLPYFYVNSKEEALHNVLIDKYGEVEKIFLEYSVDRRNRIMGIIEKDVFKEAVRIANEKAQKLIDIYSKKNNNEEKECKKNNNVSIFDILDF